MNGYLKVLGINERNLQYVYRSNPRRNYWMADDKIRSKKLLEQVGIPVPKMLFSYVHFHQLRSLQEDLRGQTDFAIKPSRGMGGGGIVVFESFFDGTWISTSGRSFTLEDIRRHAANILHGVYSIDNTTDAVLLEEKIQLDSFLEKITFQGIPDIRLIVFGGRPIMAMLRIPTRQSEGRANLHAGGIGVGVDLESGRTTTAKGKKGLIERHPDTHAKLSGMQIPYWNRVLEIAKKICEHVPLGYIGIDFVVDKRHGPQVIELNVRPGLEIQNVNQRGLKILLENSIEETDKTVGDADRLSPADTDIVDSFDQ